MNADRRAGQEKARQRQMNPVTLEHLKRTGVDPSTPLEIVNVFYVFAASDVGRLVARLEDIGLKIVSRGDRIVENDTQYWKIDATAQTLPRVDDLNGMTDRCNGVVNDLDAEYDGWYVEV